MSATGRGRRELVLVVALDLLASAVVLVGSGRTWATGTVDLAPPLPTTDVAVPGVDVSGARALALVGLAGAVAVVAARGWLRRAVGLLLLVAGLAVAVDAAAFDAVSALATGGQVPTRVGTTAWPAVTGAAGVVLATAGLLTAWRGPGWSTLSARYEPPAPAAPERPAAPADAGERDLWEALDRGEDPTAG